MPNQSGVTKSARGFAIVTSILLCGASAAAWGDVSISTDQTQNMSCTGDVCTPTAASATLNVTDLENMLASGNVEVTTKGSGVQAGAIEIDGPLAWSSGSGLTLDAYNSIRVERSVRASGSGALAVVTNDGGSGGTFSFGSKGKVTFANVSGSLSINGLQYGLVATLPALARAIAANPAGAYALARDYDATHGKEYSSSPIAPTFEGSFNGLGNAISNLRINDKIKWKPRGLFSELGAPASVASLRLLNVNITAREDAQVGAIVGANYGAVFDLHVTGTISTPVGQGGEVGGVASVNYGTISAVSSGVTLSVGASDDAGMIVGGLAATNSGVVNELYSTGPIVITGLSQSVWVGGLLGTNGGITTDCYASGSVSESGAGYTDVGGLIGLNSMNVATSYSTGSPDAELNSYVGGFIGFDQSNMYDGTIDRTYWDTTTSDITNLGQGAGNISNDPGITGKTTAQLQAKLPKGFSRTIWAESANINNGLPYLIANPPAK